MKDGAYSLDLDIAGDVRRDGWCSIIGESVRGGDTTYSVAGVVNSNKALSGQLQLDLHPAAFGRHGVSGPFAMTVIGEADDERFTLVGLGPRGAIIEISGTRIK